jgi:Rps23 Pro-64 3,4-dihydroxylase Tpa1-like proline 4-hydroxylase
MIATTPTLSMTIEAAGLCAVPFAHAVIPDCLGEVPAEQLLRWFETSAPWRLIETDFYEQYEFSLYDCSADEARLLTDVPVVARLRAAMGEVFSTQFRPEVSIVAHKLLPGQHIGIHNDYLDDGETHRLTVQLNRGLEDEDGGFFMTFSSSDPRDVYEVHRPVHRSAVVFAITPNSYHAVSRMHGNARFTIVLSFRELSR